MNLLFAVGFGQIGCATPETEVAETYVPLSAPALARRMSLDIRGTLPTTDELDAVEADPGAIDDLREDWLADPLFEERMVHLFQESWHTRADEFRAYPYEYGYGDAEYTFLRSVGDEPLRLVARIAATDEPWSNIVTTSTTMANEVMADIWPVTYPEGAEGWQESSYTDGRPAAGVLTTNGLMWRYNSPNFNVNRSRAAAVIRLLACEDILARPVILTRDADTLTEDASRAVTTNASCLACHATIEPIATLFYGFSTLDDRSAIEMNSYHPEREPMGEALLGVSSAWFGQPVDDLAGLGRAIAADTRFVDCAVSTMSTGLLRRPVDDSDMAMLALARTKFIDGGLRMKDVIRSVTDSDTYQAGALEASASDDLEGTATTSRMLDSARLRSVYADLGDGWSWLDDGADQLDNDWIGYRILGGSVDGISLLSPQQTPGLTWTLVVKRTAQAFAHDAAEHDLAGNGAWLLPGVSRSTQPGDYAWDLAFDTAFWRLMGRRPATADREAFATLWAGVYALADREAFATLWAGVYALGEDDPAQSAWASVLAALLRDPEFVSY